MGMVFKNFTISGFMDCKNSLTGELFGICGFMSMIFRQFSGFMGILYRKISQVTHTINPMCPSNDGMEDTEHFLLLYPSFGVQRTDLLAGINIRSCTPIWICKSCK